MLRSMTGFGKGTEKCPGGKISAEIKTLNHKTLSISCNPFNGFFLLEEKAKKLLEGKVLRGKVFIRITKETHTADKTVQKVRVNEDVAKKYLIKIKKTQKTLGIKGVLEIRDILVLPGVVESIAEEQEQDLWPSMEKAIIRSVDKLVKYRETEGRRLEKDFTARLKKMGQAITKIKKYEKQSVVAFRKKLAKEILEISSQDAEQGRLEAEVALFARNCDVAEEITRLQGHIDEYKGTMKSGKPDVGKKLDFIAQEMQREANTIGAKASDFRISQAVIEVKSEIEKIREQVKNIE